MRGNVLALSFQSVAELWSWAEQNGWSEANKQGLEAFIRRFLVIPYDFELAKTWARVTNQSKQMGRLLSAGDAWIAATAVRHKLTLLSHDRDFLGLSIPNLHVICYA